MKLPNGDKVITVKDIIDQLKGFPQDMAVVFAVDAEGNGFDLMPYLPEVKNLTDLDNIQPIAEKVLLKYKAKQVVCIN